MEKYLCQLGTARDLCLAELQTVWGTAVSLAAPDWALVASDQFKPLSWQAQSGGTVKIARLIKTLPVRLSPDELLYTLSDYLLNLNQSKIYFALGELHRDHLPPVDVIELKRRLQEQGLKVRFAAGSRSGAATPVLAHHHSLRELLLINTDKSILFAETVTVQDIDDWTRRDRGKPYADRQRGMLPPKVARMMVNLAGPVAPGQLLYDPFCGTGTILLEAALRGWAVAGSDLDVRASLGAGENLAWLAQTYHLPTPVPTFARDVTRVTSTDLPAPVRTIVTEPFLGRQTPTDQQLPGIYRGLSKLYWGAFRAWRGLLTDGARVVIVFPRVVTSRGHLYQLDGLLDKLATLGYNKKPQKLIYARPQAVVQREICVFEYNKCT